jgi:DNA sulfur modification protein DndC
MRTLSLFENERLSLERSIELSVESLRHYGSLYKHWAIAFSGGKDSSATVTLVVDLIEKGQIPKPDSLTVLYADTRQELPPLHNAAMALLDNLRGRGFDTRVVLPKMDHCSDPPFSDTRLRAVSLFHRRGHL